VIAAAGTTAILKLVDVTIGLRVGEEEEAIGLDLTQHGELAYHYDLAAIRERTPELISVTENPLGSVQPAMSEAGD
jgi:hypothetical protein